MRASIEDQRRLLEVQALDTRLARLAHERRTLQVLAEIITLERAARDIEVERVRALTRLSDLKRDLTRVEDDVDQIRQRAARYQARIDAAGASAKDVRAMQQEVEMLANRTSALEDQQLEQMEAVEAVEEEIARLDTRAGENAAVTRERTGVRDAEFRRIDDIADDVRARRDALAATLPADLVKLYDEVRIETGGLGAVALYGARTEGANIELPLTELAEIRAAAPDVVVTSEEHGYILVRQD